MGVPIGVRKPGDHVLPCSTGLRHGEGIASLEPKVLLCSLQSGVIIRLDVSALTTLQALENVDGGAAIGGLSFGCNGGDSIWPASCIAGEFPNSISA